jgi:hypothetical protein
MRPYANENPPALAQYTLAARLAQEAEEAPCKRKTAPGGLGPSWRRVDNKTHSSMLTKFTPKKAACDEAT